MRVFIPELQRFCERAFARAGLREQEARTAAEALVTTDSWGIFTHGVKNLAPYLRRIAGGGIRSAGQPRVVADGPAWALVDGDSALGMVASSFAMRAAIEKARLAGIGYAGLRNSCHFGAAGFYASLAVREGMIGIAMCNDTPTVTVPGGRGPVLGSNPIAFAAPAGVEWPILMDIATSTVAGGKVFAAASAGQAIPDNWLVDAAGRPTTNPGGFPQMGALTPMTGHKGTGLALMIEVLSAVLTGASVASRVLSWSFDDQSLPTGHGAAFLAISIDRFSPLAEFQKRLDELICEVRSAPRAEGVERIYLPGEKEWEHRERASREGMELPPEASASLRKVATDYGWDLAEHFKAARPG